MPPVPSPSGGGSILTRKTGPFQNWVYAAALAGLYFAYSKYKSNAAASSTTSQTSSSSAEPSTAPYYVIENNLPATGTSGGTTSTGGVTVTPPGKSTKPPVPPPLQGGSPPGSGRPPVGPAPGGAPALNSQSIIIDQAAAGDTWASIAQRFGISAAHLQQFNAQAANRQGLPAINTSAKLTAGEQVAVPWANR